MATMGVEMFCRSVVQQKARKINFCTLENCNDVTMTINVEESSMPTKGNEQQLTVQ